VPTPGLDRVIVTVRSGSWVKVVVPDQPTPLDRRGYPGWVPTAQLTARPPVATGLVATVVARTTYLRIDDSSATARTEISFGTRLPRVGVTGAWERVVTPTGQIRRLYASAVGVRTPGAAALRVTGGDVVRTAQMFVGLPYLWGGCRQRIRASRCDLRRQRPHGAVPQNRLRGADDRGVH